MSSEHCDVWPINHAAVLLWERFISIPHPPWVYAGMSGVIVDLDWSQVQALLALSNMAPNPDTIERLRFISSEVVTEIRQHVVR